MKRMISLLVAAMLVASCGTAPQAELTSESRKTTGADEEREGHSDTAIYATGAALALVALCAAVPAVRRPCLKQFRSADGNAAEYAKAGKTLENPKDGIFYKMYASIFKRSKKSADEAGEQPKKQEGDEQTGNQDTKEGEQQS